VTSPQGGTGRSSGTRAINQATGSCPSSRRYAISGSATGSTAEMSAIRKPDWSFPDTAQSYPKTLETASGSCPST
jgi:hypothetical protein